MFVITVVVIRMTILEITLLMTKNFPITSATIIVKVSLSEVKERWCSFGAILTRALFIVYFS